MYKVMIRCVLLLSLALLAGCASSRYPLCSVVPAGYMGCSNLHNSYRG
jgi:hypothetical protein